MLQGRAQPLRDKLGNNQYRHVQERPPSPGAPPSYFEITILDEHELPDNEPDYDLMGAHRDQRPTPRSGEELNRLGGSRGNSQERLDAYGHAGKAFARQSIARSSASPPRVVSGMRERSPAMSNGSRFAKPSMLVYDDVPPDAWVSEFDPVDEDDNEYKVVIDEEEEYRLYQEFKRRYRLEREELTKSQQGQDMPVGMPMLAMPRGQNGVERVESWTSEMARFASLQNAPGPRRRSELIALQSSGSGPKRETYELVEDLQWNPAAMASPPESPRESERSGQSLQVRGPPGRRNVQMPTALEIAAAREEKIRAKQAFEASGAAVMASSRKQLLDIPHNSLGKDGMPVAASRDLDLGGTDGAGRDTTQPSGPDLVRRTGSMQRATSFKKPGGVGVSTISIKVKIKRSAMKNKKLSSIATTKSTQSKQSKASVQREPMSWEAAVIFDIVQALNDLEWVVRNDQVAIDWNADPADPDIIIVRISDSVDAGPMTATAKTLKTSFLKQAESKGSRLRRMCGENEEGPYDIVLAQEIGVEYSQSEGIPNAIEGAPQGLYGWGGAKSGKKGGRRPSQSSQASRGTNYTQRSLPVVI